MTCQFSGGSASGPTTSCFGDFPGDGGPGIDLSSEFGKEFNFGRFAGGGAGGASNDSSGCGEER